jgi:hypothetical protein
LLTDGLLDFHTFQFSRFHTIYAGSSSPEEHRRRAYSVCREPRLTALSGISVA